MNGEITKRAQLVVDEMVASIRDVERRQGIPQEVTTVRIESCYSAASVVLRERQIELDEETADRQMGAMESLIASIDDLTMAVRAERAFELNLGDGRSVAGWIGIPAAPPMDAVRTHAPGEKVQVIDCTEGDVMGKAEDAEAASMFDEEEDRDADERNEDDDGDTRSRGPYDESLGDA